ncbi:MAG: DegV family protein [Defluviitaleaceae bacterium]|nr:DegV family protein [Defluviitaleaceae bacterium]
MPKIAVVTDSNSGITQEQGKKLGITVLPMPVIINGELFFEDISLSQDDFYKRLSEEIQIKTSQPALGDVMECWEKLLSEYDQLVHIPMSSGLSASCESATVLARDFDGRVHVVDNQRISVTQRQSVLDAIELAGCGWDALQIKTYLEDVKLESSIYIMLDTLHYLKKGGRVTPAGAAIGTLLKIKPILQIQGGKLDAYAKARGTRQAHQILIDAVKNDFKTRFANADNPDGMWMSVAYTFDRAAADEFKNEAETAFPGFKMHIDPLSLSVSSHIGPGALALACCKKIKGAAQ